MKKFVITDANGNPYITRWSINLWLFKIFIHKIHQSDDDRELHDHPWNFISFILKGSYIEHLENDEMRLVRWINLKKATTPHRLQLFRKAGGKEASVWTLVFHGKKYRKWGFIQDGVWISHEDWLNAKFGEGNWNTEFE